MSRYRGDDVQRSIELLDKVLSEYDENETEGDGGAGNAICSSSGTEQSVGITPDDESPSLGSMKNSLLSFDFDFFSIYTYNDDISILILDIQFVLVDYFIFLFINRTSVRGRRLHEHEWTQG